MSERKVLSKYYPPDFDPSKLTRQKGPKPTGPKVQTVRLMAPFSMRCSSCGEYIYKGRKFNARKETTDQKYLSISIFRFYIRCTRCSSEITFTTDPKALDYKCEKGATRNFEPWRAAGLKEETEEERLDRLEAEAERDSMADLEAKTLDAKTEMAVADALDEIRTRNAKLERVGDSEQAALIRRQEKLEQNLEDDEIAKQAFRAKQDELLQCVVEDAPEAEPAAPSFTRVLKKKKDYSAVLGIKKKPSFV